MHGAPETMLIRGDPDRLAHWRKPRGIPLRSVAFLFEAFRPTALIRPPVPCVARVPHLWGPAPAAKYINIDAFDGKTVTRETLLRYTFKSLPVNVLIGGKLYKTTYDSLPF
jgi:hypothetical protein